MLIAEIRGKAVPELEGIEDLITSSVFGHLRLVPPSAFWSDLFRRAKTVENQSHTLTDSLRDQGVHLELYERVDVRFWPNFEGYGEPDLLLTFSGGGQEALLVLIEVKLNAGKSSKGERDQLARYLRLIDDPECIPGLPSRSQLRVLIFLTRAFASDDLLESVVHSSQHDAIARMFGIEWNDLLEVAALHSREHFLLREVRDFLARRGLANFSGFNSKVLTELPTGTFYGREYFRDTGLLDGVLQGNFYE